MHDTKTGKNVPNEHKMKEMDIKYPGGLSNVLKGHRII
jgi:hypothetical protein